MDDGITVRDLRLVARTIPQKIAIELLLDLATSSNQFAKFVELIEKAIDWAAQEMARNPQARQGKSEDELTYELILALKAMGFDTSHDTQIGGHSDIVIEGRDDFLWLGEAKKHVQDYSWLYEGFQQLNSRYSTGSMNQDIGGIIIYCFECRIDRIMQRWEAYLTEKVEGLSTKPCALNQAAFHSHHIHGRTGRNYDIRHVPVSLHFQPRA